MTTFPPSFWNTKGRQKGPDKMAIACVVQEFDRHFWRGPHRSMPFLYRRAQWPHGQGCIDDTDLFGPSVIIGHIDEPPERPKTARLSNRPSGLFPYLPIQRLQGRFARIDAAARQLDLVKRIALMGQQ